MALVKCEHCGEQIAGNAEHCPKCGGIYTRKGWKRSDIISAIQATISGISAIIALGVLTYYFSQYRTTENWKKREFVATQIKEFHSDKINEAVLLMLDYDPARIELFPDRKEIGDRYVDVSFETLVAAVNKEKKYTEIEFEVRKFFEHFLNSLSRFNYYISYDAIHPAELCTELGYPIGI